MLSKISTYDCRGLLLDLRTPKVMGIINITPDSFYDGNRLLTTEDVLNKIENHIVQGAAIIDIGAASSRPGAGTVRADDELTRLSILPDDLVHRFPNTIFSIDSFQPEVVKRCLDNGWQMINDITGGQEDDSLWRLAVDYGATYVLMHMKGKPSTMQDQPVYQNVTDEIMTFFVRQIGHMHELGLYDIILDPGFGFGKTLDDNYRLLKTLEVFTVLDPCILVGLSRKSMIYKLLDLRPDQSLTATSALHMQALQAGAKILRAHDVAEAVQVTRLYNKLSEV